METTTTIDVSAVISAAGQSNLGILALMAIALSVLAYFFFANASEKLKTGIFVMLFLGVVGFGLAMFRATPEPSSESAIPVVSEPKLSSTIRFWIESLPSVPGADSEKLFNNALGSWQAVIPTNIIKSDSRASANLIVRTEPNTIAVATPGPPRMGDSKPLRIIFGLDQQWTPATFEAASCRMLGHILGLDYTNVPGQLMTEGISLEKLPLTPQPDDIQKVRALWGR